MITVTIDGDSTNVQITTEGITAAVSGPPEVIGGGGSADWGDIGGTLSDQTDLQAALDAKQASGSYAAAVHSHIISDTTGLQTAIDGKAATAHSHIIGDVTNLQSTLDGKAATSHNHVISDVTSLQTSLNDAYRNPQWRIINAIGAATKFCSFGMSRAQMSQTLALTDGQFRGGAIYVSESTTLTGITFYQVTQGNFTGDNTNGLALYSYSGGTLTKVAETANDANIWKNTSATFVSVPFTSQYVASIGVYYIFSLYNSSAFSTHPAIGTFPTMFASGVNDYTNSAKMAGLIGSQSTFPTPQAMSGVTANTIPIFFELY